jgi:hypothetical protein
LQIAPSAYCKHAARQRNPELQSSRAKRDAQLMPDIQRVWDFNQQVYGTKKGMDAAQTQRCSGRALYRYPPYEDSGVGWHGTTTIVSSVQSAIVHRQKLRQTITSN